jgi:hypothetical protein
MGKGPLFLTRASKSGEDGLRLCAETELANEVQAPSDALRTASLLRAERYGGIEPRRSPSGDQASGQAGRGHHSSRESAG